MKSEFLKLAGVKTDKQFYAKFPDEASFFKAYPQAKKMIKKAQYGTTAISGMTSYLQNMQNMQNMQNVPNMKNVIQGQMQSSGVNAGIYSGNNTPDYNKDYMNMSLEDEQLKPPQDQQPSDNNSKTQGGMNIISGAVAGVNKRNEQKKELKYLQTWDKVFDVAKRAAISNQFAEKPKNTWIRPDDENQIFNINQMHPGQGVGTNILSGKNGIRLQSGGMIGGNSTEIQNTYGNGSSIYDDLEYEPLYEYGGEIPIAQYGIASKGGQGFGQNPFGGMTSSIFPNSGGEQIGSSLGSVFGPVGALAGGMVGGMTDKLSGKIKTTQKRIKQDVDYIAGIDNTKGTQNYLGSIGVAKYGGNVNPQIISQFGGNNLMSLLAPPNDADMLRAGGHIRGRYVEPNQSGLSTMEQGGGLNGSLQPMWGGAIKDVSYNPYLGNMAMGFGNDHDESDGKGNTGIGMKVLDDGGQVTGEVEIETKEPMINTEDSVTVLGARIVPKELKNSLNIKKGTTFKKIGEEIGKQDNKINNQKDKILEQYLQNNPLTSFDKLEQKSKEMMLYGFDEKQKINANILKTLSSYQNDSEEISNSLGYEDVNKFDKDLEKGKLKPNKENMNIREAMFGTKLTKAQEGVELPKLKEEDYSYLTNLYETANKTRSKSDVLKFQKEFHRIAPEYAKSVIGKSSLTNYAKSKGYGIDDLRGNEEGLFGKRTIEYKSALDKGMSKRERSEDMTAPAVTSTKKDAGETEEDNKFETIPYKKNIGLNMLSQLLPYLKQPYEEGIDPAQFAPEINAMIQNKLEPVPMQQVTPFLDDVIDISYQDILNENDSDFLTALKGTDNPAMKASLLAQKYGANAKVLGEQFRANQLSRNEVFSGNRAKLYDAQVKNIGAAANQFNLQELAKSKTKETQQEAFKSITDKRIKHDADLRKYNTYKTLFPQYGFEKSGKGVFEGGYNQFDIPYIYGADGKPTHKIIKDANGNIMGYEPIAKEQTAAITPQTQQNAYNSVGYSPIDEEEYTNEEYMNEVAPKGRTGKKINKNYSQSSIVKAFK